MKIKTAVYNHLKDGTYGLASNQLVNVSLWHIFSAWCPRIGVLKALTLVMGINTHKVSALLHPLVLMLYSGDPEVNFESHTGPTLVTRY